MLGSGLRLGLGLGLGLASSWLGITSSSPEEHASLRLAPTRFSAASAGSCRPRTWLGLGSGSGLGLGLGYRRLVVVHPNPNQLWARPRTHASMVDSSRAVAAASCAALASLSAAAASRFLSILSEPDGGATLGRTWLGLGLGLG